MCQFGSSCYRAINSFHEGKLILRVGDEQVVFDVFRAINSPLEKDEYLRVDSIDLVAETIKTTSTKMPLELCFTR